MKVEDVVYEVIDAFLDRFVIFPMRSSFHSLGGTLVTVSGDTLARFKENARDSVSQLPPQLVNIFNAGKAPSRSMQTTRAAVNVFNILDKTALRFGVSSSADITGEGRARGRALEYDANAQSIRSLHGSLPMWVKSLPVLFMVYVRCAVKVAQKKYMTATANLEGDDVLEVFTNYVKDETIHELETLCSKLQSYLSGLKEFVENNCCVPDMDPSETENNDRSLFLKAMKHCKSLLLHFNEIIPILQVVDGGSRKRLEYAWKTESEDTGEDISAFMQECEKGILFCEKRTSLSTLLEDIRFLRETATDKAELLNRVGSVQISAIASAQQLCSAIARSNMPNFRNVGYVQVNHGSKKRKVEAKKPKGSKEADVKSEFIRNNHLQTDIFCVWNSVMSSDAFLDEQLIGGSGEDTSSLQIHLSEEWYKSLFSSILVPCIVENAVGNVQTGALPTALSRVLRRFVEK